MGSKDLLADIALIAAILTAVKTWFDHYDTIIRLIRSTKPALAKANQKLLHLLVSGGPLFKFAFVLLGLIPAEHDQRPLPPSPPAGGAARQIGPLLEAAIAKAAAARVLSRTVIKAVIQAVIELFSNDDPEPTPPAPGAAHHPHAKGLVAVRTALPISRPDRGTIMRKLVIGMA